MIINHEVSKVFQKKFLKIAWHAGAGADALAERRVRRRRIAVFARVRGNAEGTRSSSCLQSGWTQTGDRLTEDAYRT